MPRVVKRAGGDVILVVKNITPQTRADLELLFEDPQADRANWQTACSVEKSHGRLERRTLLNSPYLNGLFFREWGEIGQVFRIERERTIKETKKGTCYEHAKYKTEKADHSKTAVGCGTPYTAIANDA